MSGTQESVDDEEVRQLRESVALLTTQCAQLGEANRAWQEYQQAQVEGFRSKLQDYVLIDENTSFENVPELIMEKISKERSELNERYQALEEENLNLRSGN